MKTSQILSFLTDLLFPPLCLHCDEETPYLLCSGCAAYFELIDPWTRCSFCFSENDGRCPCPECIRKKRWQMKIASALDYLPPVQTVVKRMKYGRMPYLAKTAGAFMFMQFERLGWETPDFIVPVPRRLWFQGTNHAALLATAFARLVKGKVHSCVGRGIGDLSQARLNREQRESLHEGSFYLKRGARIEGKTLLLIDDVMTTGTTLRHTAEALKEGFPEKIYALTFARAMN